jgi:hypothetical protein
VFISVTITRVLMFPSREYDFEDCTALGIERSRDIEVVYQGVERTEGRDERNDINRYSHKVETRQTTSVLIASQNVDTTPPASLPEQEDTNQHSRAAGPRDTVSGPGSLPKSTTHDRVLNPTSPPTPQISELPAPPLEQEDMNYHSHESETETHEEVFEPASPLNSQTLDADSLMPQSTPIHIASRPSSPRNSEYRRRERLFGAMFDRWSREMARIEGEHELISQNCNTENEAKKAIDDFRQKAQGLLTRYNEEIEAVQLGSSGSQSETEDDEVPAGKPSQLPIRICQC